MLGPSRPTMSPPMTPPETCAGSSPKSVAVSDVDARENNHNAPRRSNSLVALSDTSLLLQLDELTVSNAPDVPEDLDVNDIPSESLQDLASAYVRYLKAASIILESIKSEDDVAYTLQNREALPKVESRLKDFESNVSNYVLLVERLTSNESGQKELYKVALDSLDEITAEYEQATQLVGSIKTQIFSAEEWADCQESLDAIQSELKDLRAFIYLAEEQRHVELPVTAIELDVLATILEDAPEGENTGTPGKKLHVDGLSQWDRAQSDTITRLTGKLSPLKASIYMFRPRLELFRQRAQGDFPTAVSALSETYDKVGLQFRSLLKDFVKLKEELAEDKWMAVFRQVNKQASEMMKSLVRSLKQLGAVPFNHADAYALVEKFEMKSEHYGKSIPSVLSIMKRGVKDRLTVNGEIVRGYDLLTQRWAQLSIDLADMNRRIQGARASGILQASIPMFPQNRPPTGSSSHRQKDQDLLPELPSSRKPRATDFGPRTPRASHQSRHKLSPERSYSPSPAITAFRKDTSLDPPRSRSRLAMQQEPRTSSRLDTRPPWNAGTVARILPVPAPASPATLTSQSPSRSSSRLGAQSSLGFTRSHTPSSDLDRRVTGSLLPQRTPRKSSLGPSSHMVPSIPSTPTFESRAAYLQTKVPGALGPSRLPPPSTPANLRSSLSRPKTPTSIPVSKRMVSNPEGRAPVSTLQRPRTASANVLHSSTSALPTRSGSSLGGRRLSGIPLPSPQKLRQAK